MTLTNGTSRDVAFGGIPRVVTGNPRANSGAVQFHKMSPREAAVTTHIVQMKHLPSQGEPPCPIPPPG